MKSKFLILFFVPAFLLAQDFKQSNGKPKTSKNEIGINLYSVTDLQVRINNVIEKQHTYSQQAFSGVYFKRHINQNVVRASFDYYSKIINEEMKNVAEFYSNRKGMYKGAELRVGYERELSKKKLVPYLHADLAYLYSKEKGTYTFIGCWSSAVDKPYALETNGLSASFGFGLKYHFNNNITLTYECSAQRGVKSQQDLISPFGDKYYNPYMQFNPVRQFGLSIRF